jgi:hypothetical protein
MNLTELAFTNLTKSLENFGNKLSIPHRKALYALVESFTDMATGKLQGRLAFPIPTGCGKTRAIIEWSAAVSKLKLPYSMVVSASRIEALCTMKRDMIKAGVPADQIGLIYTPSKAAEKSYSEPLTTDNENKPFLLCSHQLIRARECNLALYNTYNGKARSLVVYDESLFISDIETFTVKGLCESLARWTEHFRYITNRDEHVDISNWLTERKARIEYQFENFEDGGINELPAPSFTLTSDQEQTYARQFRKAGDSVLADFLSVNGLPLRMFKYGKAAVITYRIVIPEALQNMIVLDASYPIRQLEKLDGTLKDAETLPFCQRERISFDNLKRFDLVTLYRMANRGSRSNAVEDKTKMRRFMQDTVEIIKSIPADEGVLVFVYKEKHGKDPKSVLESELEKAGIDTETMLTLKNGKQARRLTIETWGNETSLNSYAHCKHVILVGILHRDLSDLAAQYAAQLDNFSTKVDGETLKTLCLSERAHCAYQALSRGCLRVMGEAGQASTMTGYIIEFEEGLEAELNTVMQGATWREWKPVYSDLVEHGKTIRTLADRLDRYLRAIPEDVSERSAKRVWSDLGATKVPRETRSKAVQLMEERYPLWNQHDQWFRRSESTVTFSNRTIESIPSLSPAA